MGSEAFQNELTGPEKKGIFANTLDSIDERWNGKGMKGVEQALKEGNIFRYITRLGGVGLGTIGDVLAAVPDAIFEAAGINKKVAEVIQKGLDTEAGKKLVKLAEDNPEYAGDIGALFDAVSVIPSAKYAKNVVNDVLHNVATKVEGGAPGDAIQAVREKIAQVRNVPAPEKPNFYNAPALQPLLIAGSSVDGLWGALNDRFNPFQAANTRASGFTTNRRREIDNAMKAGKELDAAGSAAAGRTLNEQRYNTDTPMYPKGSPLDKYQYATTQIPSTDVETLMQRMGGRDIPKEVTERHLKDLQVNMLSGKSGWDEKLNSIFNAPEYGTTVDILNPNAFRSHAEMADLPMDRAPGTALNKMFKEERLAALPEGTTQFELSKAAKTADNTNWRLANKMGSKVDATKYILKAVEKQKSGLPLNEKEAKAMSAYEKTKVNPTDNGFTHSGTSYVSGQKQLGGVHQASSIKDKDIYNTVSDRHNLFGMSFIDPAVDKVAVFPTQKRTVGKEGLTTEARQSRYMNREDVNTISTAELEKLSGVPRKKGEDAVSYQLRAIGEVKAQPGMQDFAEVLKNLVWTGYVGTSNMEE